MEEVIGRVYGYFLVRILRQDSRVKTCRFFCKVGAKVHEWARYEICCVSLERFRLEGGNTFKRINAIDEKMARAYERNSNDTPPNFVIYSRNENTSFNKIRNQRN